MLIDTLMSKGLSHREAEVANLVCKGMSNKEAAGQLFVTEKTIKFHLTNVYKKLAVKSRAQLIVWAGPKIEWAEAEQKPAPVVPEQSQNLLKVNGF